MKTKKTILTALTIGLLAFSSSAQNVGINGSGANAHQSAALDVSSTNTGLLIPRVTDTTTVNSAATAGSYALAEGLMIYDLTDHCIRLYDGTSWTPCLLTPDPNFPVGYVNCGDVTTVINDVVSPVPPNRIWMDRNLGASQVAISPTDALAYGDLFQWGRAADGHQCRFPFAANPDVSVITSLNSTTNTPVSGVFILEPSAPFDWRVPQNDNLWQGVNGVNNPCPVGYRIPTFAEWSNELGSFSSNNTAGAFGSFLILPTAGYRTNNFGSLSLVGSLGFYWSSTVNGTNANYLYIDSGNAFVTSHDRARGHSVRCIKD